MRLHWPLVSLGLLFLIPVIVAGCLLWFGKNLELPLKKHGDLIEPPQKLQILGATDNKWNIIYVKPDSCNLQCQQQLQALANLQTALGKDSSRVAVVASEVKQIKIPDITPGEILLLNPMGLYIMHYDAAVNYNGILKDMRRLLKYSHVIETK